jgi:hypothetical protein
MSTKSPLAEVNEKFGGKDKLVDKLVGLLESDESKDDMRQKLLGVANKKLIRLHGVATTVKEKYGSRDKLLQATLGTQGKDKDYVTRVQTYSTPRLVDMARIAERRAKIAESVKATKARAAAIGSTSGSTPKKARAATKSQTAKAAKSSKPAK